MTHSPTAACQRLRIQFLSFKIAFSFHICEVNFYFIFSSVLFQEADGAAKGRCLLQPANPRSVSEHEGRHQHRHPRRLNPILCFFSPFLNGMGQTFPLVFDAVPFVFLTKATGFSALMSNLGGEPCRRTNRTGTFSWRRRIRMFPTPALSRSMTLLKPSW